MENGNAESCPELICTSINDSNGSPNLLTIAISASVLSGSLHSMKIPEFGLKGNPEKTPNGPEP
jgi:hypothetical protein